MDALVLDDGTVAVNMVVVGTPPDRLAPLDAAVRRADRARRPRLVRRRASPRSWSRWGSGGTASTSCRAATPATAGSRSRPTGCGPANGGRCAAGSPSGSHLPHPRILTTTARHGRDRGRVRAVSLEVDGVARSHGDRASSPTVRPEAYRLLV